MEKAKISKKTIQLILIGVMAVLIIAAFVTLFIIKKADNGGTASDYVKSGDKYMKAGDTVNAYKQYKAAYDLDSDNIKIIYKLFTASESDEEKHILAYRYLDLSKKNTGSDARKDVFSYLFDSSTYNAEAYKTALTASEEFSDFLSNRIDEGLVSDKEKPVLKDNGYIYFGTYPQRKINNEEFVNYLKNSEFDSEGYTEIYGKKYFKYNNGNEDVFFAVDGIEWMVLASEDNQYQVITNKVLDCESLMEELVDSSWDMSHLREWVNNDYRKRAFTEDEYAQLKLQFLENPDNYCYGTTTGTDTEDYLIILSCNNLVDSKYGFKSKDEMEDDRRIAYCSDYAVARGLFPDDEMRAKYWTSSNGSMNSAYVYINYNGIISVGGELCINKSIGVRPVITVDLSER